jgi:ribonuclease P protein component
MGFVRAWKPSGDVKYSAADARRDASDLPSNSRANTQEPDRGFGFPRRNRLTRSGDFQTVIREGKRVRTVHLDARVLASPLGFPRVGIVVPRHQQSAVDRNTLKRRLRELVRVDLLPTLHSRPPIDVAIRARREAYAASFDALRTDVLTIHARVTDDTARP